VFNPVTLERSKVITVSQFVEEVLQDIPVTNPGGQPILALEVVLQILLNPIVVEQRVVYVDKKDQTMG
jgi:hypothetical protein